MGTWRWESELANRSLLQEKSSWYGCVDTWSLPTDTHIYLWSAIRGYGEVEGVCDENERQAVRRGAEQWSVAEKILRSRGEHCRRTGKVNDEMRNSVELAKRTDTRVELEEEKQGVFEERVSEGSEDVTLGHEHEKDDVPKKRMI